MKEISMKLIRKLQMEHLVYVLLLVPFLLGCLNELLGLPRAIRYVMDIAWCMLLVLAVLRGRQIDLGEVKFHAVWVCGFLVYTLIVYVFLFQSPFYYLWGFRNNFRFYAAFFAFVIFMTPSSAEKVLQWFDVLFWVNFVVSLVQFFGFGIKQDYLGGIFGTESGVNGYTNIFFLIIVSKSLVFYLEGQEKLGVFVAKCVAALVVSVLAELKFFFVEFLVVLVMAVFFIKFKMKNLWIVLAGFAAAIIGAAVLSKLFPDFQNWFSIKWLVQEASADHGYSYGNDLNRLTAIPMINDLWLTDPLQRLFGLGMGNCDTSSFSLVNTPFFQEYGQMHYNWLSYAIMYLECGCFGLLFYMGFFALVFCFAHKLQKNCEGKAKMYCQLVKIIAPFCCLISIYNSSLRVESGYMMYFVLALPFLAPQSVRK